MQRHLAGDPWQSLHEKVGRPHPRLDRAKGMFNCLTPLAHGLRVLIEALLHGLDDMLMLPSGDQSFLAVRAAILERTVAACICPIAPQLLAFLLVV